MQRPQRSAHHVRPASVGWPGGQQPPTGGTVTAPSRRPNTPVQAAGHPKPLEATVPDEYLLRLEASGEVTPAPEPETEPETEEEQ